MTTIEGNVASGFEALVDSFAATFAGAPTMGAALSVRIDGELVANLWGGVADERAGTRWTRNTPSVIYSCTKGLMSALIARLVDEGRLDYDAPVARYWPEFAANGKAAVTVGQALSHRAGLSAPRADLTLDQALDWNFMVGELARQEPLWTPDSGYAYHAITHGWLTGELIRRVTGKSARAYFTEVTAPLALDAWIGLPPDPTTVAHLQLAPELAADWQTPVPDHADGTPDWPSRAMTLGHVFPEGLATPDGAWNDRRVQAGEWPGAGGIASAEGLATFWSATVAKTKGVDPLLSPAVIARATEVMSEGPPVFPAEGPFPRWGMGFLLDCDTRRVLTPTGFGHDGAGGQVGFADPQLRVGFGYVTNWLRGAGDERGKSIIDTLRGILTA
jgi:CubicO group peptidase (beta-lactamase class C family)